MVIYLSIGVHISKKCRLYLSCGALLLRIDTIKREIINISFT